LTLKQTFQVRTDVQGRLSGTQHVIIVRAALRLVLKLGNPELRGGIETVAIVRAFAEALVLPVLSDGSRCFTQPIDSARKYA